MRVEHYLTPDGRDLVNRWLDRIRDRRALVAIERRIARIERDGYLGDHKYLRDGVSELRIDEGAGYRIYYAQVEQVMVLLLCGGDKSTQASDVIRAVASWEDFQRRRKEEGRA